MKKQFFYATAFLCVMVLCGSLMGCSDDDDDDNGGGSGSSGVKKCYFEAEDQRTDFKYAYYYAIEDDEIELSFSTVDFLYYYQHPDKIKKGTYFASVYISIGSDSNIPTGEIPYDENGEIGGYSLDMDTRSDLYEIFTNEGDDSENLWYCTDWNPGYESGSATVTKSGNTYKIDIPSLKLLRGYDGISSDAPKTTGKFYFEGSFMPIGDLDGDGTRSIREVNDPDFWKWLKALQKTNRAMND